MFQNAFSGIVSESIQMQRCLACGAEVDRASVMKGNRLSQPGDISICFYCTAVFFLDERLMQRLATDEELGNLDTETMDAIIKTQRAIRAYRASMQ
jgi:hypothetical protein